MIAGAWDGTTSTASSYTPTKRQKLSQPSGATMTATAAPTTAIPTTVSTASAVASAAVTLPTTADDIRHFMSAIDLHDVARHFDNKDDDVNPYFVCDGVSIAAFNAYVRGQERLRVGLRFLQLSGDGRLLIVELPNSTVHESTAWEFGREFYRATVNDREVASRGSMTASRDALPDKEADASFGPRRTTPHRNAPPQGRTIADWLTLVVEVGLSQTWPQLIAAATWWCGYAGIEYILLLKVSADATRFEYRFYDIVTPGVLPDVPTRGFQQSIRPDPRAINIEFNMRRILSIPPNQPLPPGVNQVAVVNLRDIMDSVIRSI
ncbi:hypothetical protein H257_13105 [Aphanomyces astaci]|uniref:Uncharacterized protein n=1 Tax=Aphanomyces astaci TaxID=112090 RepID=W4FXJ0_APHAT|nr:hypothetical protein H257_13105 [Aphanomyces astaci]ETV71661.1 hypothetical protein H257_13105 [Aphanomyces astaci]|eukprot:XP_009838849.1 hypothetical protein H257_13105 [Aphanomyces astaci]